MMAGLQSPLHFQREAKILEMPMSLGFSRPRIARCFITDTNSLLLSFPSPSLSKRVKTTSVRWSESSTWATFLATCCMVALSMGAPATW